MRLVILSGSLRRGSFNTALAHLLAELAPADCETEVFTPAGIPVYDGDVESEAGIPDAVARLKDQVAGADGFVLVTPEYNQSVPGTLKNVIDWMTRPPTDISRVFGGKPVAICGASPSSAGTRSSQYAWLPVFRALKTRVYSEKTVALAGADQHVDDAGRLSDEETRTRASKLMEGFCEFARAQ